MALHNINPELISILNFYLFYIYQRQTAGKNIKYLLTVICVVYLEQKKQICQFLKYYLVYVCCANFLIKNMKFIASNDTDVNGICNKFC